MSDINVFMHAIQVALQSTLNNAIATAVAEATKPLLARIEALESNPAIGTDTVLYEKITALETKLTEAKLFEQTTNVTIPIDEARMVEALNGQEWFWEKVNGFVESRVGEAMDDHTSSYDHDEYDEMHNEWGCETTDEFVRDNDLEEKIEERVNDVLRNASFSISI